MQRLIFLKPLISVLMCLASAYALGQGTTGTAGIFRVDRVRVVLDTGNPATQNERKLEADAQRLLGIYPGRSYSTAEIDLALARLRTSGLVEDTNWRQDFTPAGGIDLVVTVRRVASSVDSAQWYDRLRLVDDGRQLLKLRLGLKGAVAVSDNQWFGNGDFLTEFNPRGQYDGGPGPNTIVDMAPTIGLVGAMPLSGGANSAYLYANALYLGTLSVGQDNNRNDTRATGQWEEAFVGVVDGGITDAGSVWRANLSYGRQSYCIGNGMLICQIASSGGDRGADFAWPRWTANDFLKVQIRLNQTLVEAFDFEPNDFPNTHTRLKGVNAEHDNGHGMTMGLTWLMATSGNLGYYLPDGQSQTRDGLRVWSARAGWWPIVDKGGFLLRGEYAHQSHADFNMDATAYSIEGGWSFPSVAWWPSMTYRFSRASGDDPDTAAYERWDLLYSGDDIDTWVQGQLMKNIQYNSNVRVHRILARASPSPRWLLTGAASSYYADNLNNVGGVISTLAGRHLGQEILLVAEHFRSRQVYWRFTAASLWPGNGVEAALPEPATKPWLVGIVQFNISY